MTSRHRNTRSTKGANPQTYDAVKAGEVHLFGGVWAETLWEMYWNLVHQFDSTALTGGTHRALLCLSSDDAARPTVAIPLSLLGQYHFSGFLPPLNDSPP